MKKATLAVCVLATSILTGCVKEIAPPSQGEEIVSTLNRANPIAEEMAGKYVPNQLLVKFKKGMPETGRANALAKVSARVEEHVLTEAMKRFGDQEGVYVLHTPLESLEAVGRMKNLPEIEFAEPNYIYRHIPLAEANDPRYNNSVDNIWGMMGDLTSPLSARLGSQAGEAWAGIDLSGNKSLTPQTGSSNVYVAIIDEGVQYNHEEFQGTYNSTAYNNIFINPKEGTTANKKDDDGNGYVDDFYGWDFAGRNNTIYDGTKDDHGTHVAGTIGAKGNNGKGVAGVVWDVKIITAKFLGVTGGTTANAIKAVDYITDLKTRHGLNIVASNNSWGGGGYSQGLKDAIERANTANILFVAAAGNEGKNIDNSPSYPASYSNANIISVGALWLDETAAVPSYSNYGANSVDLFAPGHRIWSTTPGNTYSNYSGTSMATPHVTGGIALYAAANPGKTAAAIKKAILQSAIPHSQFAGKCLTGGYLDVHSAWQNISNNSGTY